MPSASMVSGRTETVRGRSCSDTFLVCWPSRLLWTAIASEPLPGRLIIHERGIASTGVRKTARRGSTGNATARNSSRDTSRLIVNKTRELVLPRMADFFHC